MIPQDLSIKDFTYELPDDQIAYHPLSKRDASKLLVAKESEAYSISTYEKLAEQLPTDSLIIFNNTRVVAARLIFKKSTGAKIEIFCIEPGSQYPDVATAMHQTNSVIWYCMVGGAAKWKNAEALVMEIGSGTQALTLKANLLGKEKDLYVILLSWDPATLSFSELLQQAGQMPLPPYIKRSAAPEDSHRYQTVFAKEEGSVAAPTAGLHFTERLMESLQQKNIHPHYLTLHVGAGTFQPVKADKIGGHTMHSEYIEVDRVFLEQIADAPPQGITAVGTTSLRTLESLYWMGLKAYYQPHISLKELPIQQWEVYQMKHEPISLKTSMNALIQWMNTNKKTRLITTTQIIIAPGYAFHVVDRLITNFHQPQSTLLLLIAAFMGPQWKDMYAFALANNFRFLSYGDGCLLHRK